MGKQRIRRAVIVGAGIGGPVLGMWLRQLGIEVVLAEARESAALGEGAFLGVAPNGMNVLQALGVADVVAAHGHPCSAFGFSNRKDRAIGSIDRTHDRERFRWPLTMIRRGQLHVLLADEAARRGVDLRFGKRLSSIDCARPNEIAACFADGTEVAADILVGSDGLRSTVRSLILPDAPAPVFSGLLDYGGFAPPVALPFARGVNQMVYGRRAFFGAFAIPNGETWWFHNGPAPDPNTPHTRLPEAVARERLLDLHREDPAWIGDLIRATPNVLGSWPLYDLCAMPRWWEGRACLIGDAAHAMSPSSGQGASLAMEDAMVLAQCLRDIAEPAIAFRTFEQRRRRRVDAIFQQARRNGSAKAVDSAWSEWFRDRLLPIFLRFGASGQTKTYAYRIEWEQSVASGA